MNKDRGSRPMPRLLRRHPFKHYRPRCEPLEDRRLLATFTVNVTDEANDALSGDGRCDTNLFQSGDQCSLRAAIEAANENADADEIDFAINSGVQTINVRGTLLISNPVTIDATTQPGFTNQPLIVLHGPGTGTAF